MKTYRQHSFFDDTPEDSSDSEPGPVEESSQPQETEGETLSNADGCENVDAENIATPEIAADADPDDAGEPDHEPIVSDDGPDSDVEADADAEPAEEAPSEFFETIHDPGQDAVNTFFGPPRLDRPRPERPRLIPQWLPIAGACVIIAALLGLGLVWWSSQQANIPTPKIAGVDVATATTRLAEQGLKLTVSDRHFSTTAAGTVLSQTPAAGTKLRRGDSVTVIISAGTEQFTMPDVVGNGLLLAEGTLATKGLDVRVERQPSQQPSDTVLASNPPPGAMVHTGDIVRLTVAAAGPATAVLLPYDMTGVTVLLDPAPAADALTDVPLDVARRLRSLVEASHGTVVTTRALADSESLAETDARAQKAAATSATVAIGFSTLAQGAPGLVVYAPSPVLPHASASAKLVSRITSDLASSGTAVRSATSTSDTVLAAASSPWTRVQLGALSQKEDLARFSDPAWEDAVARGIYKSIAALYGRKSAGQP